MAINGKGIADAAGISCWKIIWLPLCSRRTNRCNFRKTLQHHQTCKKVSAMSPGLHAAIRATAQVDTMWGVTDSQGFCSWYCHVLPSSLHSSLLLPLRAALLWAQLVDRTSDGEEPRVHGGSVVVTLLVCSYHLIWLTWVIACSGLSLRLSSFAFWPQ